MLFMDQLTKTLNQWSISKQGNILLHKMLQNLFYKF